MAFRELTEEEIEEDLLQEMEEMKRRAYVEPTGCCALAQVRAGNQNSMGELVMLLHKVKLTQEEGGRKRDWIKHPGEGGWKALFAVCVMPFEKEYQTNLFNMGFKEVFQFERREGYNPGTPGHLSLLVRSV